LRKARRHLSVLGSLAHRKRRRSGGEKVLQALVEASHKSPLFWDGTKVADLKINLRARWYSSFAGTGVVRDWKKRETTLESRVGKNCARQENSGKTSVQRGSAPKKSIRRMGVYPTSIRWVVGNSRREADESKARASAVRREMPIA